MLWKRIIFSVVVASLFLCLTACGRGQHHDHHHDHHQGYGEPSSSITL